MQEAAEQNTNAIFILYPWRGATNVSVVARFPHA